MGQSPQLTYLIKQVSTDEVRRISYSDLTGRTHDETVYLWTDGNYSCDCNRSRIFDECEDEFRESEHACGESEFRVNIYDGTGKCLLFEFEPEQPITSQGPGSSSHD